MMIAMIARGETTSFEHYLKHFERSKPGSVVWRWEELAACLATSVVGERGSIALAAPGDCPEPCIAPGISAALQVIPPGEKTAPHAHSFWHIYFVRSGYGELHIAKPAPAQRLTPGDIIFIPAWCDHSFTNVELAEPLVFLALQNLPAMAELGSLARRDEVGRTWLVHAENGR
jgi:gentisate 1,2-dioxygenase